MAINILKNKTVLYVLLFIALSNVLGYLTMRDYDSLTLMVAIGILMHYFSKNMIIILSVAILGTAFLRLSISSAWNWYEREGMSNKSKKRKHNNEDSDDEDVSDSDDDDDDDDDYATQTGKDSYARVNKKKRGKKEYMKKRQGKNGKINHKASKLRQYENLQNILSPDGMKQLTNDSQHLIDSQKNLMEQMQSMGPVMENAQNLLKTFEGSGMMGMIEKVLPMLNKLQPPNKKNKA